LAGGAPGATILAKPVAHAAHRLERLDPERPVDLLAEVAHVDIDHVRPVLVLEVPRALEKLVPGEHLASMAHERLEQGELLRRERDLRVGAPGAARCRVDAEVARLEDCRPLERAAAHKRAQAGEQLSERERLRQVIVGASVETRDSILECTTRGQHQDRRPDPVLAQAAAGLEAVDPRQHHVQDEGVVLGRGGHPERVLSAPGDVDREPLLAQPTAQQGGHLHLVLDDQDAHLIGRITQKDESLMRSAG
jgi:hypothetical protein